MCGGENAVKEIGAEAVVVEFALGPPSVEQLSPLSLDRNILNSLKSVTERGLSPSEKKFFGASSSGVT